MQWLLERQLRPLHLGQEYGLKSLTQSERNLLDKAVAAGNVHAMIDLGILLAQSHDMRRSLTLFDNAAAQSDVASQNASWVRQRILMERRISSDRPSNKVTASQADVLFKIARKYHRGEGVSVNYVEAIRLYRQADAAGSQAARRMLSLIYARTTLDGSIDPVWMRQLSDMDVASLVPKQDATQGALALHKEPTPLIDLLPRRWRRLMD
jgi:TPR repeat protein